MKIRLGFVSNSSSTSYVIALTRDFKATPEQLEKFIDQCEDFAETKPMIEQAKKAITEVVEKLCSRGEHSWTDYDSGIKHLFPFLWTFEELIISEINMGHGVDSLSNIFADDIKDKALKQILPIIEKMKESGINKK